ncbi:MAG: DUF3943 domain-containing protein [Desulfobacteraceae bacterium]|jgi:hypothetical protein|nr:DUF3943 domain-containing protein [Desulfobacteraceae bacterium]
MYHGFARSAGLNYWEALLYDNAGSFLWETGKETTDPSINDQFASGIGGSFFGEALFRMAGLVLEGDGGKPGFWQELGAGFLSPFAFTVVTHLESNTARPSGTRNIPTGLTVTNRLEASALFTRCLAKHGSAQSSGAALIIYKQLKVRG